MLLAPRSLEWVEQELPPPEADEVLVQTVAGAVSVGTELPIYLGTSRSSQPLDYPRMTGYESLGRVIACGAAIHDLAPGDRLISFYGHRTHAILKRSRAIRVPPGISDRLALLAILSCDVAKGIHLTNVQPAEPVLITGAGTIGLLTLYNLKQRGVEVVQVIEPLAPRRALALRLGATACRAPEEAENLAGRFPVGFEGSGRDRAFDLLQQKMAPGGRICILADGNLEPLVLSPHFHEKELQVIGSSDGEDYPGHAAWFFEQVRQGGESLESLYELETRANRLPQAFRQMGSMPDPPLKVFVRYA